jgi:hypothetical protein
VQCPESKRNVDDDVGRRERGKEIAEVLGKADRDRGGAAGEYHEERRPAVQKTRERAERLTKKHVDAP